MTRSTLTPTTPRLADSHTHSGMYYGNHTLHRLKSMWRLTVAAFLVFGVSSQQAPAQYRFDIKTPLEEKADLKIVKQGVITATSQSSWATEVEFNENYSLWLKDLRRSHQGDSMYVSLNVELRTPAAITSGDLISERRISLRYHWQKAQKIAKDSVRASMLNPDDRKAMMKFLGMTGKVFDTAEDVASLGFSAPGEEETYVELLRGIVTGLQYRPSPVQVMEALLLGRHSLRVAEEMVKDNR